MPVKLLFVDDELDFERAILQRFRQEIRSGEYEIIFVHSGEEALEAIEADRNHEIELLITDLKMPAARLDGFGLIGALRDRGISLKTLIVSAYGDVENYQNAIREDVLLFLTKPINILELKPLIEEALKRPESIGTSSRKVRLNTLQRVIKELPSGQKGKLIENLLESLDLEDLERLREELPDRLNERIEAARKREEEKQILVSKIKNGEIDVNTPLEILDGAYIEEKYIPKDGKTFGPYYYLRWWEEGRLKNKYLGKKDPRKN
ncbi:response regulator [Pannus brasiliensis CCIBt3594]|uniref:Response regulator n=1 Tax=Pannus brasiliensis CCIBt3594 TaxID=1427578 RepID=A0AAW9QUZ9_9CHRO